MGLWRGGGRTEGAAGFGEGVRFVGGAGADVAHYFLGELLALREVTMMLSRRLIDSDGDLEKAVGHVVLSQLFLAGAIAGEGAVDGFIIV